MPRINVGRYKGDTGHKGFIEPEDLKWVVFVRNDGAVIAYNREENGAVVGEPAVLD